MPFRSSHKVIFSLFILLTLTSCSLPISGAGGVTRTPVSPKNDTPSPQLSPIATSTPADGETPTNQDRPYAGSVLLTLEEKIGQLLVISIDDRTKELPDCELINTVKPGGMFLHPENVATPDQLRELTASFQQCAEDVGLLPLFTAIDHEGEYINRFDDRVTNFPTALAMGATGNPGRLFDVSYAAGSELRYTGINMILGPVADVLTELDNKVVGMRTYGGDASQVGWFVEAAITGYQKAGLITVLKHFPGHGNVSADSHKLRPVDLTSREGMEESHLPPFRRGIESGSQVVMLSHVAFPMVTGNEMPTSLSPELIEILHNDIEFNGVILSDAMDMKAITGENIPVEEASLHAILAGVDLLLVTDPNQARAAHRRLVLAAQSGELPQERLDEALTRILNLKENSDLTEFPVVLPDQEPDWEANQKLAIESGQKAVTLFYDADGIIPLLPEYQNILIVAPQAEDWFYYPELEDALIQSGRSVVFTFFPSPWEGNVIADQMLIDLPISALGYDLVLVFTWESHIHNIIREDPWQIHMVNSLASTGVPRIVVGLKSPTDIIDFTDPPSYLATYGTTPGAMRRVIDILLGTQQAEGSNPLPNLIVSP